MARKPNARFKARCRDLFHAYGKRILFWDDLTNEDKGLLLMAWPNELAPNAFEHIVWDIATEHRKLIEEVDLIGIACRPPFLKPITSK